VEKPALLLIHGMGKFTAPGKDASGELTRGNFGEEFIKAATESLQRYKKYKTNKIDEYVDIHEFNYDAWFDKMRMAMADRAKGMKDRLDAVGVAYGITFPLDLVGKLTSLEADFGDDDSFHTHWLDVIFYTTLLGAKVRVDAGQQIAKLVRDYGRGNVHIMAHSLGTAVLHDTLHLLYRPESDPEDEIPDLHPTNHKLGSVWMIANVSRLVNSFTRLADPLKSVVRPGDDGCTSYFCNVRHQLDPFTWYSRFDPANNGAWVPESIYISAYKNVVTELVIEANTHSFTQYLHDPAVAEPLLFRLTPFDVAVTEMDEVSKEYSKKSINGAATVLEDAFHKLEMKDIGSWQEFIRAGEALNEAIKRITNNL
jgi:hypothetical protein